MKALNPAIEKIIHADNLWLRQNGYVKEDSQYDIGYHPDCPHLLNFSIFVNDEIDWTKEHIWDSEKDELWVCRIRYPFCDHELRIKSYSPAEAIRLAYLTMKNEFDKITRTFFQPAIHSMSGKDENKDFMDVEISTYPPIHKKIPLESKNDGGKDDGTK